MTAPYEHGQTLAWIEIDPDSVRVHRATVETIQTAPEPDRWSITTDRGVTTVDQTGIGSNAVPIGTDIAADLYVYGDGYSIPASLIEIDRTADEDRSMEQGDDLGPE